ncbi:hypothetical protein C2S51_009485 [Perilla frutescens var. frutescens]|nr:hypothetical protein C2S51_009485 [Perilla frutescens var. frutescens]
MGKKRPSKKSAAATSTKATSNSPFVEQLSTPVAPSPPPTPVAAAPDSPVTSPVRTSIAPSPTVAPSLPLSPTAPISKINAPPPFLRRSWCNSTLETVAPSISMRHWTKPPLFVDLAADATPSGSLPLTPMTTPLPSPPHQTTNASTTPSTEDVATPSGSPPSPLVTAPPSPPQQA